MDTAGRDEYLSMPAYDLCDPQAVNSQVLCGQLSTTGATRCAVAAYGFDNQATLRLCAGRRRTRPWRPAQDPRSKPDIARFLWNYLLSRTTTNVTTTPCDPCVPCPDGQVCL